MEWQLGMRVGWKVCVIRSGTLGDKTSDQGSITIWRRDICDRNASERLAQGYSVTTT